MHYFEKKSFPHSRFLQKDLNLFFAKQNLQVVLTLNTNIELIVFGRQALFRNQPIKSSVCLPSDNIRQ